MSEWPFGVLFADVKECRHCGLAVTKNLVGARWMHIGTESYSCPPIGEAEPA